VHSSSPAKSQAKSKEKECIALGATRRGRSYRLQLGSVHAAYTMVLTTIADYNWGVSGRFLAVSDGDFRI
jgi:hypothetical protein